MNVPDATALGIFPFGAQITILRKFVLDALIAFVFLAQFRLQVPLSKGIVGLHLALALHPQVLTRLPALLATNHFFTLRLDGKFELGDKALKIPEGCRRHAAGGGIVEPIMIISQITLQLDELFFRRRPLHAQPLQLLRRRFASVARVVQQGLQSEFGHTASAGLTPG